jgi:hypothetical protein
MKLRIHKTPVRSQAYALTLVLCFSAVSLTIVVSAMNWMGTNAQLNERSNQYHITLAAAEAATEAVVTKLRTDYKNQGDAQVTANLSSYADTVPTSSENSFWSGFTFSDATGSSNRTYAQRTSMTVYTNLNSQYAGLKGFLTNYRIISNARKTGTRYNITAAVHQDVQTASIPIFQFAVFYNTDLELHPVDAMEFRGPIHSNGSIYMHNFDTLTFWNDISAVGTMARTWHPLDDRYTPGDVSTEQVNFWGLKVTNASALSLPIGTNGAAGVRSAILDRPVAGESINSPVGQQRYYNKAELVIMRNGSGTYTISLKQPYSSTSIPILKVLTTSWLTEAQFYDQREGKTMKAIQIDVGKLSSWSLTNLSVIGLLGAAKPISVVYVGDTKTTTSSEKNAVRLVNGQTLPSRGLTVATPSPLYVKGHYNQPTAAHLGTTNTSNTKPASLVSDALTILSSAWDDTKGNLSYTARDAVNTTINAGIITGIVATTNSPNLYSGGAHNLGRYLEDWTGKTITYNSSMVAMYESVYARGPFETTGSYYGAPIREHYFDQNFTDPNKLPPGTPSLRVLIRGNWLVAPPNTTNYVAATR